MERMPTLSLILPCLNEEEGLRFTLPRAKNVLEKHAIHAEIIVVDNGSTDRSREVASGHGARVVREHCRGYGATCAKGFEEASGKYLLLADADGSYDFSEIPNFLMELEKGADFAIGNRFKGKMAKGAMPWPHRYIGNPFLSYVVRLFFNTKVRDAHCGMRAIRKSAYQKLSLVTPGMEFASEMVVQAARQNLLTSELPINYHARIGSSKLKPLPDGWRHLRFMLNAKFETL